MFKKIFAALTLVAVLFLLGQLALPFAGEAQSDRALQARKLAAAIKSVAKPVAIEKKNFLPHTGLKFTGEEIASDQSFHVLNKTTTLTSAGTAIGHTAYNYQTNDNLHDRIVWDPATGTIHTQWIYGDLAEAPGFANRRMRYNFHNRTSWAFGDQGVPIETERAGFGSLAIDANNIAVPVSHVTTTGNEGTLAWLDFQAGFGFFSALKVHRKLDNLQLRLEPLWPDIAVDRQGNFHVIAINNNQGDDAAVLNNVRQNILYWKSTNRGVSWGNFHILFPDTTTYPLTIDNRAGNSQIAVSDTDNGKVGILVTSAYNTLYFFESNNGGETWERGSNITGKFRLGQDAESFTQHPQQFDVINIDSSDVGGPQYMEFIEWPITNAYVDDGPIDSRPPAPADLLYINGEPHVVWNEVLSIEAGWYPAGAGYSFRDPAHVKLLKGGSSHIEGGFFVKHWSPSTGISVVARYNESPEAYAGSFSQWLTQPQLGKDATGNLYCLYTQFDDADTLRVQGQRELRWGPLSRGEIWGAKSHNNGATWFESVNLSQTRGQNERYIGISDLNPTDVIHIIYQSASIPGTAVGSEDARDHAVFVNADILHWAIPTSLFPTTPRPPDPEIELSEGVLDFRNTPGIATRSFLVSNIGNADLVIEGIFVADIGVPDPVAANDFTINPASFTVPANGQQRVDITYKAATTRPDTLILAIPNNDLSEHSRGLVILASATTVSVASHDPDAIPTQYELEQNYPNPVFVASASTRATGSVTEIRYALKANGHAKIRIFDMLGREVAVLVNEMKPAGEHRVTWQPRGLTAGIYFYSLEVNGFRETRKMLLLQ